MFLVCWKCGILKSSLLFYSIKSACKTCTQKCMDIRNAKERIYNHKRTRGRREAIINAYGRVCNICGEQDVNCLQIDHINNDGNSHRLEVTKSKKGGANFYAWIVKNGFPRCLQLLCANCNTSKALLKGVTPEHRRRVCFKSYSLLEYSQK